MIGIIGAMQIEIDRINGAMENKTEETISGITFTRGYMGGRETVSAVCGVGKVFAAVCAEAMIMRYRPKVIINTGVGGTLTDELSIGDAAVAEAVCQHDMDTSPLGDPIGLISGINKVFIETDSETCEKMAECVKSLGVKVKKGVIASGDSFISDSEKKRFISEKFNAIACEMEGAAIGQVCYVNNVKFAVVRAISDGAGEESRMDYPTFAKKAAEVSAEAVKLFVNNY